MAWEGKPKDHNMEYNYLGQSGLKVSKICLGTTTFGQGHFPLPESGCNEDQCHEILKRFSELGGNFVDSADVYNKGLSEQIIGRWMERNQRDRFVLTSKVRLPMDADHDVNSIGLSRRHITASIDQSLQRLKTDYIDLYQMHFWDEATRLEESLRTMDDLIRCGKVRYVGASNLTGWQLQKIVETCKSLGLNPIASLQQQYNLLSRWSEMESFQVCKLEGVGVLTWSPLKGGLLTGKVKRDKKPEEGRLAWIAQDDKRHFEMAPAYSSLDSKTFDIIEMVEKIAKEKGKSTPQVALRWLLQKDVVTSVVMGATKISQLEDNVQAAGGWSLSAEEMQQLDEISDINLPYPYEFNFRYNKGRKNPFFIGQHVGNR